jgi:RimJ/RimL family protein N-acetyltransferase
MHTEYWVRKSAQGQGSLLKQENALVRYSFGALGMRRIGLTHSCGNEASRRIANKLGFSFEGIQRGTNILPGGKSADQVWLSNFEGPTFAGAHGRILAHIGISAYRQSF